MSNINQSTRTEIFNRYQNLRGTNDSLFAKWWSLVHTDEHSRVQILAGINGLIGALASEADTTTSQVLDDLRFMNKRIDEDSLKMVLAKFVKSYEVKESKEQIKAELEAWGAKVTEAKENR